MKKLAIVSLGCFFFLSPYLLGEHMESIVKSDVVSSYGGSIKSSQNGLEEDSSQFDTQGASEKVKNTSTFTGFFL